MSVRVADPEIEREQREESLGVDLVRDEHRRDQIEPMLRVILRIVRRILPLQQLAAVDQVIAPLVAGIDEKTADQRPALRTANADVGLRRVDLDGSCESRGERLDRGLGSTMLER